ncbi:SulP family inorganic anion transporter [Rheinheimera sp. WS51]|uniref:SulP family inorganic anion transporter n=1 Tax=Rheinheimera sp. WS51 TaxID=3425886 RepID=UPI003D8AB6AA
MAHALARSAANFKAGAQSPIASMVHAIVLLLALVILAPVLSYLPMAALAALLLMVAWNMSEAPKALQLFKTAPYSDIWVFICCFSLTVLFDMVIAITAGIVLAALLFMKQIAAMTKVTDISQHKKHISTALPEGWLALKISGPLFFAAADRVFADIAQISANSKGIILYMDGMPLLDAGGLAALNKFITQCRADNTKLLIADLAFQPLKTLARAKVQPEPGVLSFYSTLSEAIDSLDQKMR